MNKKGFLDMEIITTSGFAILLMMAWGATILGYIYGKKSGYITMPVWQLILTLVVEFGAAYAFVARG